MFVCAYNCIHCCLHQAFKKGDLQSALEHYTAAAKLDSSNTAARNNRALVYHNMGKFAEAVADCSAVLEAEPRNVKALLRRAAAYDGLGQCDDAVRDLQAAVQLEPHNTEAQKRLATMQQKVTKETAAGQSQQAC